MYLNDESKLRVWFVYFFYMKINEDDIKDLILYKVIEKFNFDYNYGL